MERIEHYGQIVEIPPDVVAAGREAVGAYLAALPVAPEAPAVAAPEDPTLTEA